ncbi:MAG: YCF48-related protein, partial [Bacteroidota bacterium]
MKLLLLVLLNILLTLNGFSQWQWQNPLPQGHSLCNIRFVTHETGFAVGECGTVIKTQDGGITWEIKPTGITNTLNDIYFPQYPVGFAVGGRLYDPAKETVIIKTSDGGESWEQVFSDTLDFLIAVHFPDVNTGFAVGVYGLVLKTTDSGNTWVKLEPGTSNHLATVYFQNSLRGFIAGNNATFMKTTDGGFTWNYMSTGAQDGSYFQGISFAGDSTGYAVASNPTPLGVIIKTTDRGNTWTKFDGNFYGDLRSVKFLSPDTGYVGGSGTDYRTTNGGATWEEVNGAAHNKVDFTDFQTGYSVHGSDFYYFMSPDIGKTVNFGTDWNLLSQDIASYHHLDKIEFPSPQTGYILSAIYGQGILLKTTDGQTWQQILSISDTLLCGISFTNPDHGFMIGRMYIQHQYDGYLYKTGNGGIDWTRTVIPAAALTLLSFPSIDTGYMTTQPSGVIQKAEILRTTDGGQTCQGVMSDTTGAWFMEISFR